MCVDVVTILLFVNNPITNLNSTLENLTELTYVMENFKGEAMEQLQRYPDIWSGRYSIFN